MPEKVTVAVAIGRALAAAGAAHAFGVVGSGNFHMTNALTAAGVPFVATRHEMAAAGMADAYTRLTGHTAVVSVHQGGGFVNSLTGVLEAAKANTGILVLAGDVARGDVSSNFFMSQDAAAQAVGAQAMRVQSAASAIGDAAKALRTAVLRRTPVVLSVPVDLQAEFTDWEPALVPPAPRITPAGASAESVADLVAALAEAERPLIIGGRGATHAKGELRALASASGALLAPSGGARGLFEGDEWSLDIVGGFATTGAAEFIADADLVVAFGAGLNRFTGRKSHLDDGKRLIQVDDRAEVIGFHRRVDLAVIGDTALVARATTSALLAAHPEGRIGYRTPAVRERVRAIRYWSEQGVKTRSTNTHIDPAELATALDRTLPRERIVVPDGGNTNQYSAFLRVPDEKGHVMGIASQSIGLGLATGMGAAVARPDRTVVVSTGDGSLLMNTADLDTAVRLGLGLVIVVYNDSAYGAEVLIFEGAPERELDIVRFPDTDIAAIARGYGCEAIAVRSLADLSPLDDWLAGPRNRPFIIDAKIEGFASPARAPGGH